MRGFDSRVTQGATGVYAGPLNGGQEVIYKVAGPFGAAQGGGNIAGGDYSSVSGGLGGTAPTGHDWRAGDLFQDS